MVDTPCAAFVLAPRCQRVSGAAPPSFLFSGITFPSPQANGLKNDHKSIVMASYCRRPPRCNVCYDIFQKDIRPLFVQYQYFSCYLLVWGTRLFLRTAPTLLADWLFYWSVREPPQIYLKRQLVNSRQRDMHFRHTWP